MFLLFTCTQFTVSVLWNRFADNNIALINWYTCTCTSIKNCLRVRFVEHFLYRKLQMNIHPTELRFQFSFVVFWLEWSSLSDISLQRRMLVFITHTKKEKQSMHNILLKTWQGLYLSVIFVCVSAQCIRTQYTCPYWTSHCLAICIWSSIYCPLPTTGFRSLWHETENYWPILFYFFRCDIVIKGSMTGASIIVKKMINSTMTSVAQVSSLPAPNEPLVQVML